MASVEVQKQRYSQELAAYTMRQWNVVRQSMEQSRQNEQSDPVSTLTSSGVSPSLGEHDASSTYARAQLPKRTKNGTPGVIPRPDYEGK
ncbi:hypothetical protein EWM64_g4539 [Hericium alpestre]|uniref:Uncharacterized protein n=1 Tax=Hericium alpestre TaxID=135208 RepID=A0A4Y9ZZJ5_9AGAM|nr:hypothetical protein EWM64_g4539 [Hericium alpestre]